LKDNPEAGLPLRDALCDFIARVRSSLASFEVLFG
jgi:hypothetical protein